jgi:hypothetical protein
VVQARRTGEGRLVLDSWPQKAPKQRWTNDASTMMLLKLRPCSWSWRAIARRQLGTSAALPLVADAAHRRSGQRRSCPRPESAAVARSVKSGRTGTGHFIKSLGLPASCCVASSKWAERQRCLYAAAQTWLSALLATQRDATLTELQMRLRVERR